MSPPEVDRPWLSHPVLDLAAPTPLVESFFLKANDPARRRALWVRLTLFSDGQDSHGETWAVLFDADRGRILAAKERWSPRYLRVDPSREGLRIGPCELDTAACRGRVAGDGFTLRFVIDLCGELPPYAPLPARMYESTRVGSKTVTPRPCASASGRVEVIPTAAGSSHYEEIPLDGWRAMQGHNWGRRHADDYAWVHCNAFDGAPRQTFFEGLTARARVGGRSIPPLTFARLVTAGRAYRFDSLKSAIRARCHHSTNFWAFQLHGPDGSLEGEAHGLPRDTVGLTYANPGAPPLYCYNSKLAELTLSLTPTRGDPLRLHSDRAALEVGQLSRAAEIPIAL